MAHSQVESVELSSHAIAGLLLPLVPCIVLIVYRLSLHPLSHIPGPFYARISSLYLYTICYLGIECRLVEHHYRKYKTSVLRIAPNAVSFSNGAALHPVYVASGGFPKAARYENFKVDGEHTIFSTRDPTYRGVRAKAVSPIFAMNRVKATSDPAGIVGRCVSDFVERFKCEKINATTLNPKAARIDVLALTYRLMMDSVTGHLFNRTYGALEEQLVSLPRAKEFPTTTAKRDVMSALPFIYAILEAGRFSLLPNWLFCTLNFIISHLVPNRELKRSFARVHEFTACIVNDVNAEKDDT